jgi:glycosyltransferase involved in cell wall biosynthesis
MTEKKNILVLTSSYPRFAGDINGCFVHDLAKRLTNDFNVFILAPWEKTLDKYETFDNLKIYRYKQFPINGIGIAYGGGIVTKIRKNKLHFLVVPFFLLMQFIALTKIVKKEKIKIIHAHWIISQGLIAVIYKKLINKNIKVLATIHGSDINRFKNIFGQFLRTIILNGIDELTVVSNPIKKDVISIGYKKEIFVYPMGVDTTVFTPDKKDYAIKEKYKIYGPFLLFVGTVTEAKGIRYLIEAMPNVLQNYPNSKLVIIGDGNLKEEMICLTRKINIVGNIIFTGALPHEQLPPYFATADVFILPSLSEGFGLVAAEAMSCGTFTITCDLPVIHDIIKDNETGFFCEIGNSKSISDKILYVLDNFDTLNHIKIRAKTHAVENFDWRIVSDNYKNLLNQI